MKPLHRQFVRTARRHPRRFAMADAQNKKVTFGAALAKTIFLARRLEKIWAGQEMVGIFLPPGVPGALVNHAAMLCGKVPVNLNYTLSEAALASCAQQCGIKTVVTSRTFLEKIKLSVPCEAVFLEDLAAKPMFVEKLAAFLMAKFLPVSLIERALGNCRRRPVSYTHLLCLPARTPAHRLFAPLRSPRQTGRPPRKPPPKCRP